MGFGWFNSVVINFVSWFGIDSLFLYSWRLMFVGLIFVCYWFVVSWVVIVSLCGVVDWLLLP